MCTQIMHSSYNFRFMWFWCFVFHIRFSVKITLFVSLFKSLSFCSVNYCVCLHCALPGKAVPEMIYAVSSGTLSPTHSPTVLTALES